MNIFEYIFPKQCLICSKVGENICNNCIKEIPYTLPSCFICNSLSNEYYTHKDCLEYKVQCFTGWYISKELEISLKKKTDLGIYSTHIQLLDVLISHLNLNKIVENSNVYPIIGKSKDENTLNRILVESIYTSKENKLDTLLIGNRILNKEELKEQIKGLSKEPSHIRILILFTSPTPALL